MVYRVYVEKKPELAAEAATLYQEAVSLLGISALRGVRIINRYDVENISRELFSAAKKTVFSEPQLDTVSDTFDAGGGTVFAVEYLPGQFDQRADSAAQCIQILSRSVRPLIRTAKVYILSGELTDAEISRIKKYVINPVEAREASLDLPETLRIPYEIPEEFTAKDFAACAKIPVRLAQTVLLILTDLLIVEQKNQRNINMPTLKKSLKADI